MSSLRAGSLLTLGISTNLRRRSSKRSREAAAWASRAGSSKELFEDKGSSLGGTVARRPRDPTGPSGPAESGGEGRRLVGPGGRPPGDSGSEPVDYDVSEVRR